MADFLRSVQEPPILSVSQAITCVKSQVAHMGTLSVTGEVTGFKGPNARSGHCYFQVKDQSAAMDVIVWRWMYQKLDFELKDGVEIQMTGSFEVYDKRASLSFQPKTMQLAGEGLLRQKVEQLKRKLEAEGLMRPERKRQIPAFCETVCVVTSLSGAVIDDVKRTLARRNPLVKIFAAGCQVQGEGAEASIIKALNVAAEVKPDAILLVRGGGSFEDLMTFNSEELARALARCPIPVVAGIGHEPDVSICDYIADRSCSTPTAAAESVAPTSAELLQLLAAENQRMKLSLSSCVQRLKSASENIKIRLSQAILTGINQKKQLVAAFAQRRCLSDPYAFIWDAHKSLEQSSERLDAALPRVLLAHTQALNHLEGRLSLSTKTLLAPFYQQLKQKAATLEALSPLRVLDRGYTLIQGPKGQILRDVSTIHAGDELSIVFAKGSATAKVCAVYPDKNDL